MEAKSSEKKDWKIRGMKNRIGILNFGNKKPRSALSGVHLLIVGNITYFSVWMPLAD